MFGNRFVAVVLVASCSLAHAYPALLPYLYSPLKRSADTFPQIEDDVVELDQLRQEQPAVGKRQHDGSTARTTTTTTKESIEKVIAPPEAGSKEQPLMPDLERQLEVATPLMSMSTTTTTSTSATTTTAAFKDDGERSQLEEPKTAAKPANEPGAHAKCISTKPPKNQQAFYGAARLAFGQNPEVLPTSPATTTTTTTTTTTMPTTTTTTSTTTAAPTVATEDAAAPAGEDVAGEPVETAEETIDAVGGTDVDPMPDKLPTAHHNHDINKETIGDILIDQLETVAKTTERRSSMPHMTAKTAQSLLRNANGQYSSFDMAQYVFWTGDETGVARAVEELIDENLITRESALKFLRDIRLGIEFLQRSYANRIFPEELRQNHLKRNTLPSSTTTSTTTTTTTSTTTEKPFIHLDSDSDAVSPEIGRGKSLDSFTFWNKLKALENESPQDLTDYDETMGRAKIVEYLYNEYSLEEILYKLAKVMFAQSLAHGSDEAQQELQKLTEFLEHEGNLGIIPVDLQKKVLRVLLTALSDTLTEHPELLPAARVNLANPFFRLPMHTTSQ
ncbi:PREDICTED: mucin-19 isoform X1 [Drosophila arizonae]|uniref:Mucin-19 isoform X1 n=1 Tax=Drosophila arizonae TaxID=7263 RepID=A0ABM1Q3F9_DROAR|nr:PREDICTED: mucin-19 isoform X1 [Drosophila arizonae]